MENWISWLPVLVQSLVTAGTFFLLWKRATPEIQRTRSEIEANEAKASLDEVETIEKYINIANTMREQSEKTREEVKELRKEIYDRDRKIMERDIVIDDLKDWAERLIHQLKSVNKDIEPVPYKPGSNDIINV